MQPPVVDDLLLNIFQGTFIGAADQQRTVNRTIEFLCDVAVISPDLGIVRRAGRIEDAHDLPVSTADVNRIADLSVLESIG